MHEIELKAHLDAPEQTERLLSLFADFSFRCIKKDRYWTLGEKSIRIRQELTDDQEKFLITHKLKNRTGAIEINRELEFELATSAVPAFTAMLESFGFIRTAEKRKDTKVFMPHPALFKADTLCGRESVSVELSVIEPIGAFLEIEVLYADEGAAPDDELRNAQSVFDTLLTVLEIPQSAIEPRPYNELLAGCRKPFTGHPHV